MKQALEEEMNHVAYLPAVFANQKLYVRLRVVY